MCCNFCSIPAAKSRREIDQSAVWVDPGPSLGSTNAAEEADLQEEEPPLLFNAELLGSRTIKLKPKSQDGNGDQVFIFPIFNKVFLPYTFVVLKFSWVPSTMKYFTHENFYVYGII